MKSGRFRDLTDLYVSDNIAITQGERYPTTPDQMHFEK